MNIEIHENLKSASHMLKLNLTVVFGLQFYEPNDISFDNIKFTESITHNGLNFSSFQIYGDTISIDQIMEVDLMKYLKTAYLIATRFNGLSLLPVSPMPR